jgi:hypothetical protein
MRALVIGAVLLAFAPGCDDCGGCLYREAEPPRLAAEDGGAAVEPADAGDTDDAAPAQGDSGRAQPVEAPPGPPPLVVAQQFVVGWASGRLEPLVATSDEEAGDMLRRALAGETVETPFGPMSSEAPPASSFSFSDRRAEVDAAHHRITFTVTLRRANAAPASSRHTVFVRRSDGKVVRWIAPSPLSDGGV